MQILKYSVDHWGAAGAELVRQLSVSTGTTRKQRRAAASGIWQLARAADRNIKPRQQLAAVGIYTFAKTGEQFVEICTTDAPPPKVIPTIVGRPPAPSGRTGAELSKESQRILEEAL